MRTLNRSILIKEGLIYSLLGLSTYLLLYMLLNQSTDTLTSLLVSTFSGLIGVIVAVIWLFKLNKTYAIIIIIAYVARVLVGVVLYVGIIDDSYFRHNGVYKNQNYEFSNNYFNAISASKLIKEKKTILPSEVIPNFEIYKDSNIQTWMGIYYTIGNGKNAMDLAPFNSFHHILAGVFIILLGLISKLNITNSLKAGTLVAWIPWAFPSSLLWRDSIGFAFVCIAVFLIFYGSSSKWKVLAIFSYILAFFLASTVRTSYGLIVLIIIVFAWYSKYFKPKNFNWKILLLLFTFYLIISTLMPYIENLFFFRYENTTVAQNPVQRLISFPLLFLRALAGPFPWKFGVENSYLFFDYFYHVLQFAIFIIVIKKYQLLRLIVSPIFITFFLFWFMGLMAIGVHTAYLAMGLPFLILITPIRTRELSKYFLLTLFVFILISFLYSISGFYGQGLIMNSTGY